MKRRNSKLLLGQLIAGAVYLGASAVSVHAQSTPVPSADHLSKMETADVAKLIQPGLAAQDASMIVKDLESRASGGDTAAIGLLGDVYRDGKIVDKDLAKALSYYDDAFAKGEKRVGTAIGDIYYRSADALKLDAAKATEFYTAAADAKDSWAMIGLGDVYREGRIVTADLKKAASYYIQAAEAGNSMAFSKLGDLYYRDAEALKADPKQALDYYQKGADKNDRFAIAGLADVYREGKIVAADLPKAVSLYQKAADLNYAAAYAKLGDLYYRDADELKADPKQALDYYQKGAEKKDRFALAGLGDVYLEGKIVPQDLQKAIDNFKQAADLGYSAAYAKLGDLYYRRADDLGADRATALQYYQQGADKNDRWAVGGLGDVYREGKIVPADLPKALALYQQAAELGNAVAYAKIGDLYYRQADDLGVNPADAVQYYQQGADKGDRAAIVGLADVYREGKIVPADLTKALGLYQQAADLSYAPAYAKLGDLYYRNAEDLGADPQKAIDAYQKGVDKNDRWSLIGLGDVYREGKIVKADPKQALALYQKAADLGATAAYAKIGEIYYRNDAAVGVDPKEALAVYQKGADAGDTWAMMGLGDIYREGRVVPRDQAKALSYFKAALDAGNKRSYGSVVDVLMNGTPREQKSALTLLDEGLASGVAGLVPLKADAYLYGRGVPASPKKAIALLSKAATEGDVPATVRLAQVYAEGYKGNPPSEAKALATLKRLKGKYPDDRLSADTLYVNALFARSQRDLDSFADGLAKLAPGTQASIVSRISWRNENAFVYALQSLMKENGTYGGQINGRLTKATISGLYTECRKVADDSICRMGPLTPNVRPLLGRLFRTRTSA